MMLVCVEIWFEVRVSVECILNRGKFRQKEGVKSRKKGKMYNLIVTLFVDQTHFIHFWKSKSNNEEYIYYYEWTIVVSTGPRVSSLE